MKLARKHRLRKRTYSDSPPLLLLSSKIIPTVPYTISFLLHSITWDVRAEINDRQDGSQEFNAEFVKTKFKFKKCEFVLNKNLPNTPENPSDLKDDDEDYGDDDEDAAAFRATMEVTSDKRKLKTSNYQTLACGAKGMLPSKMKENRDTVRNYSKRIMISLSMDSNTLMIFQRVTHTNFNAPVST
jgi:hypothetical protein